MLTRGLFVQPLEGDARLSLAARLQPDAVAAAAAAAGAAVGVEEAVGDVPRTVAEAAALVALQRRRWKKIEREKSVKFLKLEIEFVAFQSLSGDGEWRYILLCDITRVRDLLCHKLGDYHMCTTFVS